MKIAGKKISPYIVIIPITREDGDIILQAKAILSYERFEQLCPTPKPPLIQKRGENAPAPDFTDAQFEMNMKDYGKRRTAWMVIESLSATNDMTWELVDPNVPDTWMNWEKELTESGFSQAEQNRIFNGVVEAQGLDDKKIEEARQRFLASLPPVPEK